MKSKKVKNKREYLLGLGQGWKTVVDFTDGGRTEGVRAEEVIKMMQGIKKHRG